MAARRESAGQFFVTGSGMPLPYHASAHKKRRIRFGMRRMGGDIQERSLPRSQVYSQRMESPSCTVQSDAP